MDNNWVDFTLIRGPIRGNSRGTVGLVLKIKARPELEEFMRNSSKDHRMLVENAGELWHNCDPTGNALEYYDGDLPSPSKQYHLNSIGAGLLFTPDARSGRAAQASAVSVLDRAMFATTSSSTDEIPNLSFLRLVGIGNPEGVSIGIAGAYSSDYVMRVRRIFAGALRQFLYDYVVPMTINLHIIADPMNR